MLSVRLSSEEQQLLEQVSQQLGCSKSALARRAVKELCLKLVQNEPTPYQLGKHLFGQGELATAPKDPMKQQILEKLRAKHGYMG